MNPMIAFRLWQMCEALDASAKPEEQQLQVAKGQGQWLVAHGSSEAEWAKWVSNPEIRKDGKKLDLLYSRLLMRHDFF